jgi:site-specific recombinase XerD
MRNNSHPARRREARNKLNVTPKAMAMWSLEKVAVNGMDAIGEYAPSTILNYRHAIREYQRFVGYQQSPVNVTDSKLADFKQFLQADGFSESTAELQVECIAAVVRFADPALLPGRQVPERKAFADAEIPGTLEFFMINEYFPVAEAIQSRETKRQYGMAAARYSRFVGHPAKLADLTDERLAEWMAAMRAEGKRTKTINGYMNYIRAFWNWAFQRGIVPMAPTVKNLIGRDGPRAKKEKPKKARAPLRPHKSLAIEKGNRDLLAPGSVLWFVNRYLKERDVTAMYAKRLRKYAIKIARHVGKARLLDVFTEDNVNGFLADYVGSPYTVRAYRSDFITIWNAAADQDLLPYPVLRRIRRPKCHELLIECYTLDEVQKLLAATRKMTGEYPNGVAKRDYWNAAIRLAWDTGLRRGDVIGFNRRSLSLLGRARVIQQKTKRIVPVGLREGTLKALEKVPGDNPLEWLMDLNYFSRHFRWLVKTSGVNRGSFKWLRRSSGTYVEMAMPGAGTKHLGHSSPEVFNRHYDGHLADPLLPQPPDLDA